MENPTTKIRARQAKAGADSTGAAGEAAGEAGAEGGAAAGRSAQSLLRDSGYAALGTLDVTVAAARRLMERSNKLPDVVSAAPAVLRDTFDSLRDRGRTLTGQIKRDPEVKTAQAAAQSQTAAATDLTEAAVGAAGRAVASDTAAVVEAAKDVAAPAPTREELQAMTVVELRDLAATHEVQGYYSLNKDDLVDAIAQAQS